MRPGLAYRRVLLLYFVLASALLGLGTTELFLFQAVSEPAAHGALENFVLRELLIIIIYFIFFNLDGFASAVAELPNHLYPVAYIGEGCPKHATIHWVSQA